MIMEKEEKYSPYCKICSGCGEDGCCHATICQQHKDGAYCEIYLRDLKFAYLMFNALKPFLKDDIESKKKIDELYDKNWDLIYKETD